MKKAAIITIVDFTNIGNRLQNYAVQEILKKFDVQPETLRKTNSIKESIKNFLRKYVLCGKSSANRIFSDRYIRWSRYAQYGSNYCGGGTTITSSAAIRCGTPIFAMKPKSASFSWTSFHLKKELRFRQVQVSIQYPKNGLLGSGPICAILRTSLWENFPVPRL